MFIWILKRFSPACVFQLAASRSLPLCLATSSIFPANPLQPLHLPTFPRFFLSSYPSPASPTLSSSLSFLSACICFSPNIMLQLFFFTHLPLQDLFSPTNLSKGFSPTYLSMILFSPTHQSFQDFFTHLPLQDFFHPPTSPRFFPTTQLCKACFRHLPFTVFFFFTHPPAIPRFFPPTQLSKVFLTHPPFQDLFPHLPLQDFFPTTPLCKAAPFPCRLRSVHLFWKALT